MKYNELNHLSLKKVVLKNQIKLLVLVFNLKNKQLLVFLNPKINNTETTECVPPTEVTENSFPTSSTLISDYYNSKI